ncbi:MAG: tetratricopeptide repeat protein [Armatimonadota bacterium]
MISRLPRWLLITLIALIAAGIATGLVFLFRNDNLRLWGWILTGVLVALLAVFAAVTLPPLIRLYRFQKYFKQHEKQLSLLPNLMQSGRTQEAQMLFDGVMKHAPDNAYLLYMQAFFLQAAGKLPQAMSVANKALSLVGRDPFLPMILQQVGGQMGQPTTVEGFREQLEDLRDSLEPRVNQMRERREKAVKKREKKKKSR